MMRFLIICRVIDNLGDAGFCTRLALELHGRGHPVDLVCDKPSVIEQLVSLDDRRGLNLLNTCDLERRITRGEDLTPSPTVILEPFGTSSEQTSSAELNELIKKRWGHLPWLVIDYLSAETWTKSFHLSNSICPRTGHVSTYFYPGFLEGTGGLIYSDLPEMPPIKPPELRPAEYFEKIFVFSYPFAPLRELDECLTDQQALTIAGDEATPPSTRAVRAPFCELKDFDKLLQSFDFLFVRGEDSFVRAQLAGKPFVWNIYPTEDDAHVDKLLAFFRVYRQGLSDKAAGALLSLWWFWNNLGETALEVPNASSMKLKIERHNEPDIEPTTESTFKRPEVPKNLAEAWTAVQSVSDELKRHALEWKLKRINGPELVSEILTWASRQSPTSDK